MACQPVAKEKVPPLVIAPGGHETTERDLATRSWDDSTDYAQAKSDVTTAIMARAELWASRTGWST